MIKRLRGSWITEQWGRVRTDEQNFWFYGKENQRQMPLGRKTQRCGSLINRLQNYLQTGLIVNSALKKTDMLI